MEQLGYEFDIDEVKKVLEDAKADIKTGKNVCNIIMDAAAS